MIVVKNRRSLRRHLSRPWRETLTYSVITNPAHQTKFEARLAPCAKNLFDLRRNESPRLLASHHLGSEQLIVIGIGMPDVFLQFDTDCRSQL